MADPVKKKVKVIAAQYSHQAKCVVLQVSSDNGEFKTQIPLKTLLPNVINLDTFTEEQMKDCTKDFCYNIIGKQISVVFDEDLDEKLKSNHPLNY